MAAPSGTHQILGQRDPDRSFMVLLTPDLFRRYWTSRLYGHLIREYVRDPGALRRDLPHLGSATCVHLSRRLGWLTFEDLHTIEPTACPWLLGTTASTPRPSEDGDHQAEPGRHVVVESPAVISYDTTSPELVEARGAIRAGLSQLVADDDELLHGVIEAVTASGTDLDNLLLYNIGGPIAPAARNGVVLERRTDVPTPGARYTYRLIKRTQLPALPGTVVASFEAIPLRKMPTSWLEIWHACRTAETLRTSDARPAGQLHLGLRLDAPGHHGAVTAQLVKTLIDGLLTALHTHADPATVERVAPLIATRLGEPPEDIARMLLLPEHAILGATRDLVIQRADGIQCRPADDRVASLAITINRSAVVWALHGALTSDQ